MGPLSRLWKALENVCNEASEAIEVPMDTFATLIKQTTLLLGQASLSILYARRLNILKTLLKNPCNGNTLLKEKTALLQEEEGHLFDKKYSVRTKLKLNAQRKNLWKFLRLIIIKILPFEKALFLAKIDRKVDADTITRKNQVIKAKTKMFYFKTTRVQVSESSTM